MGSGAVRVDGEHNLLAARQGLPSGRDGRQDSPLHDLRRRIRGLDLGRAELGPWARRELEDRFALAFFAPARAPAGASRCGAAPVPAAGPGKSNSAPTTLSRGDPKALPIGDVVWPCVWIGAPMTSPRSSSP